MCSNSVFFLSKLKEKEHHFSFNRPIKNILVFSWDFTGKPQNGSCTVTASELQCGNLFMVIPLLSFYLWKATIRGLVF